MLKLIPFLLLFMSCASKTSLEAKVKKYITDSVLPTFNDPASYQYVSMNKPDTVFSHAIAKELIDLYSSSLADEKSRLERQKSRWESDKAIFGINDNLTKSSEESIKTTQDQITILEKKIMHEREMLSRTDSLLYIKVNVNYRGRNKMNALILDKMNFIYYPAKDSISRAESEEN